MFTPTDTSPELHNLPQLQGSRLAQLQHLLAGVPIIESPFFAQLFSELEHGKLWDQNTLRVAFELHTRGYALIDFPEPEFARISEEIQVSLSPKMAIQEWQQAKPEQAAGLRICDAWKFDENVRRLASNQEVMTLISRLYGRKAFPFQTLNFPVGTQQHFHTDSIHFSSVPERFMCGVWVALEDIDESNGPLMYFPGSHQWPILTNEHMGLCVSRMSGNISQKLYEEMWRELVDAYGVEPQYFHARKGQALIWAANLMHGGSPHLDRSRTRWSQVTHYFFEDCAYYTPMLSDPFYGNIAFRELQNIASGETVRQQYAGFPIAREFLEGSAMCAIAEDEFNGVNYLAANPDVAAAGVDPYQHYLKYGRKEKRKLQP